MSDEPQLGKPQLSPGLKLALDLGPLLLFFFANSRPALFEPWIAPMIPSAVAVISVRATKGDFRSDTAKMR